MHIFSVISYLGIPSLNGFIWIYAMVVVNLSCTFLIEILSYFNKYKIDSRQLVIAMGDATKYKLTEYGIFNVLVPNSFSENGLYELLFN
mgnify:CR=1 FL=1